MRVEIIIFLVSRARKIASARSPSRGCIRAPRNADIFAHLVLERKRNGNYILFSTLTVIFPTRNRCRRSLGLYALDQVKRFLCINIIMNSAHRK